MGGFQWLASYPKSGNTWLRLALRSLSLGGAAVDFRTRESFAPIAARRSSLDKLLDVQSSDLTDDEAMALLPHLYEAEAGAASGPLLRKVHDAWTATPAGEPLFPPALTLASVYIVRDPRDVAVSLAHHKAVSIDRAIGFMNDSHASLAHGGSAGKMQLRQLLLTWSGHVESWLAAEPEPLLLRYEEMVADPAGALARVAAHLGWDAPPDAVARAVAATAFDALRRAEELQGFHEGPVNGQPFFRRGIAGGWRDSLNASQAGRLERDHGAVMARLGYR